MNNSRPFCTPVRLFFAFLLLLVFLGSIFPIFDNDVWWHLKTGQVIAQSQSIPSHDIFSYTINGKHWTTYEWLAQLLLYLVYAATGLSGLTIFKAIVVIIIFLLMMKRAGGKAGYVLWILLALSFLGMRDGLRERPQLFSYLFTALYPVILHSPRKRLRYMIPLLQVIWTNMHGPTAIIGLGITGIYALFSDDGSRSSRWGLAGATLVAMLITPQTYAPFVYFYRFFHEGFNRLILEYRSPQFSLAFFPYFILLATSLAVMPRLYRKSFSSFVIVLLAAAASLLAIRNIPLFIILAVPLAAAEMPRTERSAVDVSEAITMGALLFFLFLILSGWLDSSGRYRFGTGDRHRARFAAEFLRQCHSKGKTFNDYDFGGYLIWKLSPEKKVFVDGRLLEYGAAFVERSFYYWKPDVWKTYEAEYDITAAIIPQEPYYNASYLDGRTDWVLVWWDDDALVYLKDVKENRKLIQLFGYRLLKPNSPLQNYLKDLPLQAVLTEIDRSLYYAPQCDRARQFRKYLRSVQSS